MNLRFIPRILKKMYCKINSTNYKQIEKNHKICASIGYVVGGCTA